MSILARKVIYMDKPLGNWLCKQGFEFVLLSWEFIPQDAWIGAHWKVKGSRRDLWVCLLPFLPIHLEWDS